MFYKWPKNKHRHKAPFHNVFKIIAILLVAYVLYVMHEKRVADPVPHDTAPSSETAD